MFEFQTFVNSNTSQGNFALEELHSALDLFQTFNQVLAIFKFDFEQTQAPLEIQTKLDARDAAKTAKDFDTADKLRDEITTA